MHNSNNSNFNQYDDQTITPTVQNPLPGFHMDVNTTPTPGGMNNNNNHHHNHHLINSNNAPDFHNNTHQNNNMVSNTGVLGSPVLPEDLCDELVDLLFSGSHNKQTHL